VYLPHDQPASSAVDEAAASSAPPPPPPPTPVPSVTHAPLRPAAAVNPFLIE
jgi:hypothetical protein